MYTHGIGNRMSWSGSPEPQNENPKGKGGGKQEDGARKKRKVDKTRGGKASVGGSGGRHGDYQHSHHPNKFLNMQPGMETAYGTSDTMITPTNLPAGPCSRWKKS